MQQISATDSQHTPPNTKYPKPKLSTMPPDSGLFCSACGAELGHPEEELHDPEGRHEVSQGLDIKPENSDAHLVVGDGPKGGVRLNCSREKSFTKIIEEPPDGGGGEPPEPPEEGGGGQPQQPQQPQRQQRVPQEEVFDFEEDETPEDILDRIITSESYGLNEAQQEEVRSWKDVYDGPIPPDELEKIISNLDGISNQQASLMGKKYEMMLSKWVREQSDSDKGPGLGAGSSMFHSARMPQQSGGGPNPQQQMRKPPQKPPKPDTQEEPPSTPNKTRKSRRERRVERRQEAMDEAIEEFSLEFANNMAQDAGTFFNEFRDIAVTVLKKKAESDPEWFFEKMQKWDMDLFDEVMSASDAKKQGEGMSKPQADGEVDSALDEIMESAGGEEPEPEPDTSDDDELDPEMEKLFEEEMEEQLEEGELGDEEDEEIEDEELNSLMAEMEGQ